MRLDLSVFTHKFIISSLKRTTSIKQMTTNPMIITQHFFLFDLSILILAIFIFFWAKSTKWLASATLSSTTLILSPCYLTRTPMISNSSKHSLTEASNCLISSDFFNISSKAFCTLTVLPSKFSHFNACPYFSRFFL